MAKTNQKTAKKQVKTKKEIRKKQVKVIPYSQKVTWEEKKAIVPLLIKRLRQAKREKKVICNIHLKNSLFKHHGIKIGQAGIRKLLHYIRVNGLVKLLLASNQGYWIASTTLEVTIYLKSLQKRIREIGVLKRAIDAQSHEKLGKQYKTQKVNVKRKTLKK